MPRSNARPKNTTEATFREKIYKTLKRYPGITSPMIGANIIPITGTGWREVLDLMVEEDLVDRYNSPPGQSKRTTFIYKLTEKGLRPHVGETYLT